VTRAARFDSELNGFIIARDSEKEAKETLREIIDKANRPAGRGDSASAVQQAGKLDVGTRRGMWADSTVRGLGAVTTTGFRTQIDSETPRADRGNAVAAYRKRGVDLILGGFLHFPGGGSPTSGFAGYCRWCAKSKIPKRIRVDSTGVWCRPDVAGWAAGLHMTVR